MNALVDYSTDSESEEEGSSTLHERNGESAKTAECNFPIPSKDREGCSEPVKNAGKSEQNETDESQIQNDYFGLQSDSDDSIDYVVPKARKVGLEAEVPSTRFWKDYSPDVREAVSGDSQAARLNLEPKRKVLKATVPVAFLSGGMMASTEEPRQKRKIYYVHHLVSANMTRASHSRPHQRVRTVAAHTGVVNRARWCRKRDFSHLAATASGDGTVKLWNLFSEVDPLLGIVHKHDKAASALSWSFCGRQLLSGSYDRTSVLVDVETSAVISTFNHPNFVTKVEYNPTDHRLFTAVSRDVIMVWDVRQAKKACRTIRHPRKEVTSFLDLAYMNDGKDIMASTNSCEHSLCVFDLKSGAMVSSEKEIFPERYTCPRLVSSRRNRCVLVQTHGDYICEVSVTRPYKLNRCKRYQTHRVAGYPIGLDLTCDAKTVVSGSAGSDVHLYDWYSGKKLGTIATGLGVCMDVSCHPVMANVVLVGSWDGQLALIK